MKCSGPYSLIRAKAVSSFSTKIDFEFAIAFCAMSTLGNSKSCFCISIETLSIIFFEVETKITWLSAPCSA